MMMRTMTTTTMIIEFRGVLYMADKFPEGGGRGSKVRRGKGRRRDGDSDDVGGWIMRCGILLSVHYEPTPPCASASVGVVSAVTLDVLTGRLT